MVFEVKSTIREIILVSCFLVYIYQYYCILYSEKFGKGGFWQIWDFGKENIGKWIDTPKSL